MREESRLATRRVVDVLPPILILQHYRENQRKCSVEALRGRDGVEFRTIEPVYPNPSLVVDGGIVLAIDAPTLAPADRGLLESDPRAALIVVDGTWTKIRSVVANIRPRDDGTRLERRSLPPGLRTAYPRRSKLRDDPPAGLASLEALVAALAMLGYGWRGLLEGYRWRKEFLELNREVL